MRTNKKRPSCGRKPDRSRPLNATGKRTTVLHAFQELLTTALHSVGRHPFAYTVADWFVRVARCLLHMVRRRSVRLALVAILVVIGKDLVLPLILAVAKRQLGLGP